MTDEDVWNRIKTIRKKIGMSRSNYSVMKSRGKLAGHWPALIYSEFEETDNPIPMSRLLAMSTVSSHLRVSS